MSAATGFGGDGSQTRTEVFSDGSRLKCVSDGPFAHLRPEWLGINPKEMVGGGHCFFRNLPEVSEPAAFATMATTIGADNIALIQQHDNWADFKQDLEGGPHGAIHASLGGEMNPTTSPNGACLPPPPRLPRLARETDCTARALCPRSPPHLLSRLLTVRLFLAEPLFFLHHPQIDRIWWQWQQMNPDKRLSEYNGVALHYGEDGSREVSLDDKVPMLGLAEDLTVREIMDTTGRLCYSY